MAPTVLVARIALTDPNITVSTAPLTHISGLQFGSHPGNDTAIRTSTTGRDVGYSLPPDANEKSTPPLALTNQSLV